LEEKGDNSKKGRKMKTFKQLLKEASMWDFLYRKNDGVFYRGIGRGGKGTGLGALGKGVYLTWTESMAKAYAKRIGGKGEVKRYQVKRGLKIADVEKNKDFANIKSAMGMGVKDYSGDPMFAGMLTMELKRKGYDGAVSDDVAIGIVIFDEKNVEEVTKDA
jgi:hypothetical protein